jgi:tetratricopeptide (TPR) repeat protein
MRYLGWMASNSTANRSAGKQDAWSLLSSREAERLFQLVVENETATPSINRAARLLGLKVTSFIAARQFNDALAACDNAIVLDPNFAKAHVLRCGILVGLDAIDESLEAADRAIALSPDDPSPHIFRSFALNRVRNFEEALAACDHALARKGDLSVAHTNRAEALRGLSRFTEALASSNRAIELDESDDHAHALRASALLRLGRIEEALAACDRSIALNPGDSWTHTIRGDALILLERSSEALQAFQQALELNPANERASYNINDLLSKFRSRIIDEYRETHPDEKVSEDQNYLMRYHNKNDLNALADKLGYTFEEAKRTLELGAEKAGRAATDRARETSRRTVAGTARETKGRADERPHEPEAASAGPSKPPDLTAARQRAAFELRARESDLDSPHVDPDERRRQAKNLVQTYDRLRKRDPDYQDDSGIVQKARSLLNKSNYRPHGFRRLSSSSPTS